MNSEHRWRVILDRPMLKYYKTVKYLIEHKGVRAVEFLCSSAPTAHLVQLLRELEILYDFLDIPVEDWVEWEERKNYIGERLNDTKQSK